MTAAEWVALQNRDGGGTVKLVRSSHADEFIAMFKVVIKRWSLPYPLTEATF